MFELQNPRGQQTKFVQIYSGGICETQAGYRDRRHFLGRVGNQEIY